MHRAWPFAGALLLTMVSFHWLLRGHVQAARDLYAQFFPETHVLIERWRALEVPLWLPHERLGQPFLALLYTQVFYVPRVLTALVFGHVVGPNVMHVFHCVWAFGGAFLALRRFGRSRAAAFIGSAGWAFSPFFVELSQNLAFASAASWAGWTLWAVDGVVRAPSLRSVAWLGVIQAATFHAGAPEMWVWQALLVVLRAGSSRAPSRSLISIGVAGLWAALGFSVVALPAAELVLLWTDPTVPAGGLTEWSMSWQQLVSIAVPDADFPRAELFFGADQRFFFTLLLGPSMVFLAAVSGNRRRPRPLVVLALLCAVLALGEHLLPAQWLLRLPPFRFFRFPVKYAVGLLFSLPMLAAFGVDRLRALGRCRTRHLHSVAAAALGVAMGLFVFGHVVPDVRAGFVEGCRWCLLSVLTIALVLQLRSRVAGLVVWVMFELVVVPRRVWRSVPVERLLEPSAIAETIRSEPHGRVSIRVDMDDPGTPWCTTPDPEDEADRVVLDSRKRLSVLRFLEEDLRSTSGYGFRDPWRLARAFAQGPAAFQLAGVTHFVRNAGEPLRFNGPTPSRTAIDDLWLWRAPRAFPRSWVVHHAQTMSDDEAFAELSHSPTAPSHFAPVDRSVEVEDAPDGCTSTVTSFEERPERLTQDVSACSSGVVVLADAWCPGWSVEVDGVDSPVLRTWGFLRGVAVPQGRHHLVWKYAPWTFRVGAWASSIAWVAFALVLLRRTSKPKG
jgi:hypothetical protein